MNGKKRILIVDDEESFGRIVKLNLEEAGNYEVRAETRGVQALPAARQFKPDLILLDMIMPDMGGGEVAAQIRREEDFKDIPIIFLTAIVCEEEVDSREGVMSGFPFVAKPVASDKLIECIELNIKKQAEKN